MWGIFDVNLSGLSITPSNSRPLEVTTPIQKHLPGGHPDPETPIRSAFFEGGGDTHKNKLTMNGSRFKPHPGKKYIIIRPKSPTWKLLDVEMMLKIWKYNSGKETCRNFGPKTLKSSMPECLVVLLGYIIHSSSRICKALSLYTTRSLAALPSKFFASKLLWPQPAVAWCLWTREMS